MRPRHRISALVGATLFAALFAAGACTSFEGDPPAPSTVDAAVDAGSDAVDARTPTIDGSERDASPDALDEPLVQAPIGTSCVGRTPPWVVCADFENGALTPEQKEATVGLRTIDAGSALHSAIKNDKVGFGYHRIPVPSGRSHVVWSFDVRIDANTQLTTEFGSLALRNAAGAPDFCSIQPDLREAGKIRLVEYCENAGSTTLNATLVALTRPVTASGWLNVFVDANFATKGVIMKLRGDGSSTPVGSGTLQRAQVSPEAELRIGISYANAKTPGTQLAVDNVVAWWDTP